MRSDEMLNQWQEEEFTWAGPKELNDTQGQLLRLVKHVRGLAIEESASVAENGSFLHDDALDARFGKACASAIRRLKVTI